VRWRNDGGWTREVARDSEGLDDFGWRVSIADVETDGPFSAFVGCDRILVMLTGNGMDLTDADNGETTRLRPGRERVRFAGESPIRATLTDGPTTDFNVLWDRARFSARELTLDAAHGLPAHPGAVLVAHVIGGQLSTDGGVAMVGDTLIGHPGETIVADAQARAIVVVLMPG
jgi:environmental stress-induced protein Ves